MRYNEKLIVSKNNLKFKIEMARVGGMVRKKNLSLKRFDDIETLCVDNIRNGFF